MRNLTCIMIALIVCLAALAGCSDKSGESQRSSELVLNWHPEPEFGGFYAAQLNGEFERHGLDVTITPGGSGTPGMDLVAVGHADFAIASADEVVIGRSKGMDVVALYAVYQTCPQGIMTHAAAGYDSLASVFAKRDDGKTTGIAMELGLPYVRFLKERYGTQNVNLVPYAGGIAQFMIDPMLAQQCFITSEPIAVRQAGGRPRVFLIAESGYNPYTTVVVTSGKLLRDQPHKVRAFIDAIAAGWNSYMTDPAPANQKMHELNPTLDMATFNAAAEAQKPLIQPDGDKTPIGRMTAARWQTLIDQLKKLKVIDTNANVKAVDCFVNLAADQ